MNFRLLLFFFLISCQFAVLTAKAETLKIRGASTQLIESIREDFPELFDSQFNLAEIDEFVRLLMKRGSFERVSAYKSQDGNIYIEALPIKLVKEISVVGNHIISTVSILEIIGLKEGDKFDKKKIMESGEKLRDYYADQGHFNTVIEVKFVNNSDAGINISFIIDEKESCEVTKIEFDTLNPYLQKKLQLRVARYQGKDLTSALFQRIKLLVESFLIKERFLKASLSEPDITYSEDRTKANIKYSVQEPFKYIRKITGYQQLSVFDINRAIDPIETKLGSVEPIAEAADRIRQLYLKKGFAHVQITTDLKEDKDKFIRHAIILVDEGPKVQIAQLDVTGRISRPPKYYIDFLRNNSSDLIERGYYNRADLELGHQNLITELRNQGYLKAKIQSLRTEYIKKRSQARIRIVMDEGPLTQIRKVEFLGVKAFNELELNKVVNVHSNTPLRLSAIEESISHLKDFYRQHGYLEMKIENINDQLVEYNDKGTQAHIRFDIREGPKVTVSAISIEGNNFTKDFVILREIDIAIGDILTPEKIEDSQMRLNRTGIFSQVNIRTLEEGTSIAQRTVVISLRERDPGVFRIGIGADSERELTLRQFTALSYNNIGGTARALSGRVELGYNPNQVQYLTHRATAGYLEPFLFNSRTRGRINFTREQEIANFEELTGLTEIKDSSRIDLLLERDFSRTLKFTWTLWSLESAKTFERHGNCLNGDPGKCPDQLDRIALIGPTLDYDLRDNPFVPTRGSHTRWNLSYSHPSLGSSADVNFIKSEIAYTHLWNLGAPTLVWANQVRGGYVSNLSSLEGSRVPDSQIFLLGGTSSIRGFGGSTSNERIPQGADFPNGEVVVNSESEYSLIRSEFRFPVYDSFGGVLFYDGGIVQVSGHKLEKPYRHAAGLGIRFSTPVGPVSLDIGFKLNRIAQRKEDPWRIHFFIGSF